MGIISFIIFGFIVGLIARALMPGPQRMGLLMTTVLGVVGSFVGGFLGSLFTHRSVFDLHAAGFIGSLIGAMVVMFLFGWGMRRRILA
jgi:uncharacterized membrane protein YeaQ/YmgE (transglycosylase-associated protein family)